MENRFRLKISRIFRDSFCSCRSRNLTDIIEKAVFLPQNHIDFQLIEPSSPKTRSFPSICRPRCPESNQIIDQTQLIQSRDIIPRQKVSDRFSGFRNFHGKMCPPASPVSPANPCSVFHDFDLKPKTRRSTKSKKKKQRNFKKSEVFPFSSSSDDDTDTFFSSKSRSSDSSYPRRQNRRKPRRIRAQTENFENSEMGIAVVKRSSDPYNDFRTSMVEMIVEKQIFSAKDLENLLQCFLSLNADHHHRIIVEVFMEIWDALFSDFS